jgi:hypothetical protein
LRKEKLMNQNQGKKIIILTCLLVIFLGGYAVCATIPKFLWAGELESGYAGKNHLKSNDVWKYLGEKGMRVVIAVAVDPDKSCPGMYLFAPGSDICEAHGEKSGNARYIVIDHQLEYTGTYALLIRTKNGEDINYTMAFTKMDPQGAYTIDPDQSGGQIIISKNTLPEVYMENDLMKGAAVILAPFMLLPKVVASSFFFIGSGVGMTVDLFNVPGIELYKAIVNY